MQDLVRCVGDDDLTEVGHVALAPPASEGQNPAMHMDHNIVDLDLQIAVGRRSVRTQIE